MSLTLNQIVARLRSLALSHHQVNDFYFGDPWEFDANADISYPGIFVQALAGSFNRDLRKQRYNFRVYFFDRVGVAEDSEGNETEVLSDMHQVAGDFLAMLNYTGYQDDWDIESASANEPRTEQLNDMVAGVSVDIGINVLFLSDRCQVPADDVEFETDFDMARTKILTYTGTGFEGDSFIVTGLSGKNVLAVYRAGSYKRAITTAPADSDSIMVSGTDLGGNKGILSDDGTVALESGDGLVGGEILDFLIWSV